MIAIVAGALAALALARSAGVASMMPPIALLVVLVGALLGLMLLRRDDEGGSSLGWTIIEVGLVLQITVGFVLTARGSGLGPLPSAPGAVVLVGAVLVGVGLCCLLNRCQHGSAPVVVTEAVMCVVALGFVVWAVLTLSDRGPLASALVLLPAVANAVLLVLAIRLLVLSGPAAAGYRYLVGGLTALLVADALVVVRSAGGVDLSARHLLTVRIVCLLGCALVVLHWAVREPVEPIAPRAVRLGSGRLAATLGLTLLAPALFAIEAAAGTELQLSVVLVGSSILPFLVAVHLVRLVQDGANAERRAQHDPLTGLPNRALFLDRLERALASTRRYGSNVGVMFLDLDRFKGINDTLGHAAGNELLADVAERLERCLRESDTVARMGGDEFMVLLPVVHGEDECAAIATKLLHAFGEPFTVGSQQVATSTSIGIAVSPGSGTDAETIMKNADLAMYRAKAKGGNTYQVFTADMSVRALVRHSLESSLRTTLERNELELHYQPKIDARTRRVVGLEALVRWQHPNLGFIPPTTFVSLAEETGLIVPLGNWVLEESCRQIRRWWIESGVAVPVAINLSAHEFTANQIDLRVSDALDRHGVPPGLLELEITETSFMLDVHAASTVLRNLSELGVRCSIDDFGTGYSGLRYLTEIPLHSLKIDRSFVQNIGTSVEDDQIVDVVIKLARAMHMTVIAEGVETHEQARFLLARGCDQMQGFLFSAALPPQIVGRLIAGATETRPIPGSITAPTSMSDDKVIDLLSMLCANEEVVDVDDSHLEQVVRSLRVPEEALAARRASARIGALRLAGTWSLS